MTKLLPHFFALACVSLTPSFAHADMCVALQKGERGYEDKILTLKRVASVSFSTSEQAELKEQIDQIRDMCSYKIFIELLKKERNWEPYVYSSALAAKTTDAQDAFIELVTKHPGKWQPATYRCASQIDSKEKTKLFKQMIAQAVRVDFPAIAYDVLAEINNEAQVEAFSLVLQKESTFNRQDAVFQAVGALKSTKPSQNYPFMAFKALLERAKSKDWPGEDYARLAFLNSELRYANFLQNKLGIKIKTSGKKTPDRLDVMNNPLNTFFNHQSLETLIKENHIGSIEALLPMLPSLLTSNYTLMFYSRSNQEASFQKPRAIMHTPLVDFIATFNDSTMKGGDIIETISVNKKTFEFEFREIIFKNGKAKFSAINPTKCAACHHGSDLKPIWQEYSFWMGAYGMNEDMINSAIFSKAASRANKFKTPQDIKDEKVMLERIGGMLALEKTFEEFKKFRATKDKHPRYRYLDEDINLEYPPYRQGNQSPDRTEYGIFGVPNEALNQYVGVWNVQRIFHKIKNAPGYKKERMNLLHLLVGCDSPFSNLRESLVEEFLDTGALNHSRYDELFTKGLGVNYLKMTDLTFNRDVMLLNDITYSDQRIAYLLAEDLKESIPEIASYIKADNKYGALEMIRFTPVLGTYQFIKEGGCKVLERTMKQYPNGI